MNINIINNNFVSRYDVQLKGNGIPAQVSHRPIRLQKFEASIFLKIDTEGVW